ncbi:Asparagine synthase (glutamine-hydrolyzing) [Altererythrobacter insulae]|nr:Asparagine synthase (glutamine-hydrolyzing) [Altererythrobacter insulae]
MQENLLICGAFEFEELGWISSGWPAVLDSLKPGLAGDIHTYTAENAAFAARRDRPICHGAPSVTALDLPVDEGGHQTLFAGRIFHHEELAQRLQLDPHAQHGELYAAAHLAWGDRCDEQILGAYAVIQWHPGRKVVRLARSALQAPPLHYWISDGRCIASSLPQAVFAAGASAHIDRSQLANAGLRNFTDRRRTYFLELHRVAQGSSVTIERGHTREQVFWRAESVARTRLSDEHEIVETARRLMRKAVDVSLQGSSQPAISLSGGLDSQTAASFALEAIGSDRSLRSYTSVPVSEWLPKDDPRLFYDEGENVRLLAAQYGNLIPCFVQAMHAPIGGNAKDLLTLGCWPTANEMNMHWVHAIHDQAGKDGCDVMLHAELGDSSISYDAQTAYPNWLARGAWRRLATELAAVSDQRSFLRRAIALSLVPHLPDSIRQKLDDWRGLNKNDLERWSPLRTDEPETRKALARSKQEGHDIAFRNGADSLAARAAMIAAPLSEGPELDLALRLLYGVTRRDPTAYRPLWEFCASLPDDIYLSRGENRRLARLLLKDRVPEAIWAQERVGIQSADFRGRLRRDAEWLLEELQSSKGSCDTVSLIDFERIEAILVGYAQDAEDREKDWLKVTSVVPRGIALARFVRHVERRDGGRK